MGREVGLWYHPGYAAPALRRTRRVPGLEIYRGERVLGRLIAEGLVRPGDLRRPRAASARTLAAAHTQAWLEKSARPEVLAEIFGLTPEAVDADALLRAQRLMVGGTVAAAFGVVRGGLSVAVNLGGGLHHAAPDRGAGFCVYNDVAIAVARLRARGYAAPIAVVDLDFHQGDGTRAFFARDETVFTYSIHGSTWSHAEATANLDLRLLSGTGDREYLETLKSTLPEAFETHRPKLVFLVAGADVLAADRLGDFLLTPRGVLERDRWVTELARRHGAGVVYLLGGGYSEEAWLCPAYYLEYALTGAAKIDAKAERPALFDTYAQVARSLDPMRLQTDPREVDLHFTEEELFGDLAPQPPARRLLGYYTLPGIEYALEAYGILDEIRKRGFCRLSVSGDFRDPARQIVRIHGRAKRDPSGPCHLLVELVLRKKTLSLPEAAGGGTAEVLYVEWLLLQNPVAAFTPERPPLPGQKYPGLGISAEVLGALAMVCRRLGLAAVVHRPAHYHNARVAARLFKFLDPETQGRFEAMNDVLGQLPLADASRAVEEGRLRTRDGRAVLWHPEEYVMPVDQRLVAYFESEDYRKAAGEARQALLDAGLTLAPEGA
ncbi:MAG: histone deacetylase [Deltaproteobacteria bacterium]|nr:MAG: histone deacetylase [Deltaproteobacteria bacterium]